MSRNRFLPLLTALSTALTVFILWGPVFAQYTAESWYAPPATAEPAKGAEPREAVSPVLLNATLTKTDVFPLDLATVLKLVSDQNLRLARDRMENRIQKSRFYQALAEFLPDFEGAYDQRRFQGVVQIFGSETLVIRQTTIEPRMAVNYRVYPGGKTVFDALAARRRMDASRSLVKETHQQQLAGAAAEYYDLLGAQLTRDFALKSLAEAREQVAVNEARYRAGVGTRLEILQAKTQEAQRQRDRIDADNAVALAEQALLNRLNLDTTVNLVPVAPEALKTPLIPEAMATDTLLALARKNHPTLDRIKNESKTLRWDSRSVLSELVPHVDLNAYMSYRGPQLDQLGLTRAGGLSVQTTLGDKGGLSVPTRWLEKHRLVKQKDLEYQEKIRTLEAQVVNARLSSLSLESAIGAAEEEKAAAEESYRLSLGRYKAGVGIHLDVLNAEAALSSARSTLVRAIIDFNQAQIQLLEAVGEVSPDTLLKGLTAAKPENPKPGSIKPENIKP